MSQPGVQHVLCPHCGWSFVGFGAHDNESAVIAVRIHLETKHGLRPSEADLIAIVEASKKTPQP